VAPVDGTLTYAEGTFIGYRGHAAGLAPEPAFWFGHGLGYGRWSYGAASVSGRIVSLELTNTSGFDSREVVQVYFDAQVEGQPVRLAGWSPVEVESGRTVAVTVTCDDRMWRTWDPTSQSWHTLGGGELLVARGLGDIRHRIGGAV